MPATKVTPTLVTRTVANGVDLTAALTAADGVNGNTYDNDGEQLVRVKNGSGSSVTVSVAFVSQVDAQTVPARTYAIPATTGDRLLGPFPVYLFGTNPSITFSSATTVTVGILDPAN